MWCTTQKHSYCINLWSSVLQLLPIIVYNSQCLSRVWWLHEHRNKQLSTHIDLLALTEMESNGSNQLDVSTAHQSFQNMDVDLCFKTNDDQNQISPFRNFLQRDFGHNMTQSSVVGSSCATTTLMNSQNAP